MKRREEMVLVKGLGGGRVKGREEMVLVDG